MEKVSFTRMKDGTREEYAMLKRLERPFLEKVSDRLLHELQKQEHDTLEGYRITRLAHALQCATRALRDGADDDWIVGALLHDIADGLAPQNHDRAAAEILRPFVRDEVTWVVEKHGIFQMYYYGHHYGLSRDGRDAFKNHPYYASCVDFCERWDQSSFDDQYPSEPLSTFAPILRRVVSRTAYDRSVLREGEVVGLPAPL